LVRTPARRGRPVYFRGLSGARSTPLESAELLRQGGPASADVQSYVRPDAI